MGSASSLSSLILLPSDQCLLLQGKDVSIRNYYLQFSPEYPNNPIFESRFQSNLYVVLVRIRWCMLDIDPMGLTGFGYS